MLAHSHGILAFQSRSWIILPLLFTGDHFANEWTHTIDLTLDGSPPLLVKDELRKASRKEEDDTSKIKPVHNRGKDFGLVNTAIFVPMLVAPLLAGMTSSMFHSYVSLLSVTAIGTLVAGGLLFPITSVR